MKKHIHKNNLKIMLEKHFINLSVDKLTKVKVNGIHFFHFKCDNTTNRNKENMS